VKAPTSTTPSAIQSFAVRSIVAIEAILSFVGITRLGLTHQQAMNQSETDVITVA
jgi:hypothetical protein